MNAVESQPSKPEPVAAKQHASGKLVIIAILLVALWAAATSWYFRYQATHKAAKFWGPEAATLIRDGPKVTLFQKPTGEVAALAARDPQRAIFDESAHDISHARGLVHLRNALLEDQNFIWTSVGQPSPTEASNESHWLLSFHDYKGRNTALIWFSEDCRLATRRTRHFMAYELTSISTEPTMAKGLREMFAEFSAEEGTQPAKSPAAEPTR